MIKITTPIEIALKSAEDSEIVSSFCSEIDKYLKEESRKYYYSYKVETSEELSKDEKYLIKTVFDVYGWLITIDSKQTENGTFMNNVLLNKKLIK